MGVSEAWPCGWRRATAGQSDPVPLCPFTVTTTEITHLGSCQDVNHNKVLEASRECDKQEAWLLLELQKVRRQMEHCEGRMALRSTLLADQTSSHHITVKINELKVALAGWSCTICSFVLGAEWWTLVSVLCVLGSLL